MHVQVLLQDAGNAKALFRRGRAQVGLGRTEEALKDLQAAARLAPEDRAIARELQAAKAGMRRDREAQVMVQLVLDRVPADSIVDVGLLLI